MLSNTLKSSSLRTIQHLNYEHEITFFLRFMIHYTLDNEEEANGIYREEHFKYEEAMLLSNLVAIS